jgi:hypothetical protein
MNKTLLTLLLGFTFASANAQQSQTADQNPRFKESMDKYMNVKDSLQLTNNTTVQQTYKAYDWYEARQQARQDRISFRRQLRLNRSYFQYNPYSYYDDPYRYNGNSRYHYYHRNGQRNMPWYFWIW